MTIRPVSLLIVDNDDPVTRSSGAAAMARGYRVDCATSLAAVNAAIAGILIVALLHRPVPATGRRLYPLSVAFPYIAGSVASGLLLAAMFLGIYP